MTSPDICRLEWAANRLACRYLPLLPTTTSRLWLQIILGPRTWGEVQRHPERFRLMLNRRGMALHFRREEVTFLRTPAPRPGDRVHLEWAAWHHRQLAALVRRAPASVQASVDAQIFTLLPRWHQGREDVVTYLLPEAMGRSTVEEMRDGLPLFMCWLLHRGRPGTVDRAVDHLQGRGGYLSRAMESSQPLTKARWMEHDLRQAQRLGLWGARLPRETWEVRTSQGLKA